MAPASVQVPVPSLVSVPFPVAINPATVPSPAPPRVRFWFAAVMLVAAVALLQRALRVAQMEQMAATVGLARLQVFPGHPYLMLAAAVVAVM